MTDNASLDNIDSLLNDDDKLFDDLNDAILDGMEDPASSGLSRFVDIPVTLTLEVASTEISMGELMKVGPGSLIALDQDTNCQLQVKVNGKLIAYAEAVAIDNKFGLKITQLVEQSNRQNAI
ncbi:FliM/FliN family flagellar motor switch protein [Vibrio marisflavi]|uniref:Flagellar motor switch protein FliN n=1 Tax=Vibrio marisflavi CECT 7928 TaxID=634439 RepID=A0ABN8E4V1_9VIBR|nr:FliM/FliN family flagellar motor switch protein [Vibrio marisflavi]CAH0540101.1 hypothetical protein VMF7928_02616 [Vibrio marisflavi CECT 7928]